VIFWADLVGAQYIASRLTAWSKLYGGFFTPCAYLLDRAAKGAKLVSGYPEFFFFKWNEIQYVLGWMSRVGCDVDILR